MAQAAHNLEQALPSNISGTRVAVREDMAPSVKPSSIAPSSSHDTPPELMIRGLVIVTVPAILFWVGFFLAFR